MKIYLVNEHWYEGHETLAATKNYESAFNLVMQIFMNKARINVSDRVIAEYIENLKKELIMVNIEEVELE